MLPALVLQCPTPLRSCDAHTDEVEMTHRSNYLIRAISRVSFAASYRRDRALRIYLDCEARRWLGAAAHDTYVGLAMHARRRRAPTMRARTAPNERKVKHSDGRRPFERSSRTVIPSRAHIPHLRHATSQCGRIYRDDLPTFAQARARTSGMTRTVSNTPSQFVSESRCRMWNRMTL